MARPAPTQPTDVELQILRILWHDSACTAREIHDRLQTDRQTAYSTTVKMLSVMLGKGLVVRNDNVRPQVYRAASTQHRTQKRMLTELIDKLYDGSSKALMLHALSAKKATPTELQEIRQLIEQMEQKRERR